ncbi:MAG: HD domain-containing protein [Cytophagales bacterium]|nr:HD domain-containing protein [Cytophagales bacterium]
MNYADKLVPNHIFDILRKCTVQSGVPTYVIGGYVRDLLLQRHNKDIDIVCVGSGIEMAELFVTLSGADTKVAVYKNFGTAMINIDDVQIEFVGARTESYRAESRKPIVESGTLQDDQNRRDFTINALAISLNEPDYGSLIDPFGGLEDMRNYIIKTPLEPDITFRDDPLRILRACRFASQLTFDIDPDTFEAMKRNKHRVEILSQERITEELNKIILSPVPSYGLKLLYYAEVLEIIFPRLVALKGAEYVDGKGHKDNFFHTLQVLDNVAKLSPNLWLRWAAILHDIAKPATKRYDPTHGWTFHGHEDLGAKWVPEIFKNFKLPLNEHMKYVQKLVQLHLRPIALTKEHVTDSAIRRLMVDAGPEIDDLLLLCKCDITSKNIDKVSRYLQNFEKVSQKIKEVEAIDTLRNFQPVITGEIIMEKLQLPPGKIVGEIKNIVREAIVDGIVPNEYEAALQYMYEVAKTKVIP